MAEVQLTTECNIFATGQQHTEQPKFNNEGGVDQYTEQCQVISSLLDPSLDNKKPGFSNKSLKVKLKRISSANLNQAAQDELLESVVADAAVATSDVTNGTPYSPLKVKSLTFKVYPNDLGLDLVAGPSDKARSISGPNSQPTKRAKYCLEVLFLTPWEWRRRPTPSLRLGCRYTLGTSLLKSRNSDVADLHPVAVSSEWTMDRLTDEYIGLYEQYFEFVGLRVPFSTFLLAVIRHFHVHISQLVPLGLTRLTLFELYCRSLDIVPSVTLFRVFYKLSKQGDWFSFEKRAGKDFRGKILNETFSCMKKWNGRFFFIDRSAIPDAMCWRHHDSDISDPAPKDGFDEDDVIALTNQPIDIRGIPSGLLFSAGLATTWEFPKFRPLFKDPEGNDNERALIFFILFTSSFSFRDDYRGWGALTEQDVIPQHTTTPLSGNEQVPGKMDSIQRVEASDPKIVATRIRKAQAAAKRKAEKNRGSEGASGPGGSSKRRKEKSTDQIPCPTPLRTIEAVTSDVPRGENVVSPTQTQGDNLLEIPAHDSANTTTRLCEEHHDEHSGVLGNRDGNFDDDVDEEVNLEGPDRHVSDTSERVIIGTESIPTAVTRPDNGKSIAQEETPMPDPLLRCIGADEAGSSLPPPLFVPTWGIHQRSRVTTLEECRDLMANLVPPGVQEKMHLLDNNVVLDRAWFTLARGAMAQAHTLRQFESLYDTHHALQESLETTRSHLVRTREDFNVVQNFYNTLSEKHRKLREDHDHCSEGLAAVRAEKDSLMATNAEQALRIKELEQQLKSADEVHSSAVKDLEGQLAQKDSALVYAERVSSDRLSENEELRTQLAFAKREKTDAIRKLLPTVVGRLLQSHEYKQSLSVPFNYALQTGWGQGLAEARSEEELREIMMRMNGFDPYSDKKMNAEYERLFSKTYSYVDRISHLSEKPVQDLLKLHPAPPPKDAPKAGSGGIAFAPKLVRAAEVAGSKDTVSLEFSKSKTGPSLQDPVSEHASGGSKAPPSKKT
ncbi:hypothetical protein Tco_1238124 [Tanacetum coccineum]